MSETTPPLSSEAERNARHKARMARKKAVVDAAIAAATDKRGLLLINTGNGKGNPAPPSACSPAPSATVSSAVSCSS